MKRRYKAVCVVDTVFSLMYYILLNNSTWEDTYFVFSSGIPASIRKNFNHLFLKKANWTNKFDIPNILLRKAINGLILRNQYRREGLSGLPIWGQDHNFISSYFVSGRTEPFYVLEDGFANYKLDISDRQEGLLLVKRLIGQNPAPYGISDRVDRIFLTGILDIPEKISGKVTVNPVLPLWNSLTEDRQKQVLSLFNVPTWSANGSNSVLLITQCFSEDLRCSEDEKIAYYKKNVSDVEQDKLIIKPHPRETTDYHEVFPKATILDKSFPLELLFLSSNAEIERIYSIDSSCAFMLSKNFGIPLKVLDNPF